MSKHPIQPLEIVDGIERFKSNEIVKILLDTSSLDLNMIGNLKFDTEDREQFAQLLGYSREEFFNLPYISGETREAVAELKVEDAQEEAKDGKESVSLALLKMKHSRAVAEIHGFVAKANADTAKGGWRCDWSVGIDQASAEARSIEDEIETWYQPTE